MKNAKVQLLLACMFLVITAVHAQETKKFTFGAKFGVNSSKLLEKVGNANVSTVYGWENRSRSGINFGGIVKYKLFKSISLQSEVLYTSKGGTSRKVDNSVEWVTYNGSSVSSTSDAYNFRNYKVNYFEVPLLLNIDLGRDGFNIQIGYAPSLLISSSVRSNWYEINSGEVKQKWETTSLPYGRKANSSWIVGFSWVVEDWYVDARYSRTLHNTYTISNSEERWNMQACMDTFSVSMGAFF